MPDRDDQVERLAVQFQAALERASAEVDGTSPPDEELVLCPSCGSVRVTGEEGCPRCGHGRKTFLARHARAIPWVVVAVLLVGAGLVILRLLARTP